MKNEILDNIAELEKASLNHKLKFIGILRLILSAQIIFSVLELTYQIIVYELNISNYKWNFVEEGLISFLILYYLISQGIKELKFNYPKISNNGMTVFSIFILAVHFLKNFRILQRIDLISVQGFSYLFLIFIIVLIWIQDLNYLFTRIRN